MDKCEAGLSINLITGRQDIRFEEELLLWCKKLFCIINEGVDYVIGTVNFHICSNLDALEHEV